MGIILRDQSTGQIVFYMKGADTVMAPIVEYNDWLSEEVDNMAREGLRTLVVAKKNLSDEAYADFEQRHSAAMLSVVNRSAQVAAVVESLQRDMTLLCVTGYPFFHWAAFCQFLSQIKIYFSQHIKTQ